MSEYRIKYNGGRRYSVWRDLPNGNTKRVCPDLRWRWLAQVVMAWHVGREA